MSENRQLYKYGWGKPQPLWLGKKKQERLEPYGSPSLRFEDDRGCDSRLLRLSLPDGRG